MNKKKSIALIVITAVVMLVLTFMTFAKFHVPGYKNGTRIFNGFLGTVALDGDLGDCVVYELTLKDDISAEDEEIDEIEVVKTLEARLEALGYPTAKVRAFRSADTDEYAYRIQLRKTSSVSSDIKIIAAYGELEFTDGDGNLIMGPEAVKSATYKYVNGYSNPHCVNIEFTSDAINTLKNAISSAEGSFTFKATFAGETKFELSDFTTDYLSANSLPLSSSTEESARQLALEISSGGLKYEYTVSDQMSANAVLGEGADTSAFWAVMATALAIFVILGIRYGGFGLIADLTTYLFLLVEALMLILVPNVTLSFAGILGIASATIVTFASMLTIIKGVQGEYANGKTVKASIKTAYKKANLSILEADIVLAVLALLMVLLCPAYIKGFAITFGIGIVISALACMFFSQLLVYIALPLCKNKSESFLKLKREAK